MNKNDILKQLWEERAVDKYGYKYLRRWSPDKQEDLKSEVWAAIAEIDEQRLIDLEAQGWKHLTAYIRQFVLNSLTLNGKTRFL